MSVAITQATLASAARVSIGVVRDLEQGRTTRLHAESARRLAQALGLDHGQTAKLAGPAGVSSGSAAPGRQARLRISVLGSLRVWRDGADIAIGGVMPRAVLGLLVLHPETGQRRESLIDALGGTGDDPPATAVAMIQSYVSRLRRWLDPGAMGARSGGLLAAAVGGYRLRDAACELDHVTFAALADHAQTARSAGDLAAACDAYARALALWRGEPLAAALGVYEQLRRRLDDQLGVLPGPELAAAHSRVLRQHIPAGPSPVAGVALVHRPGAPSRSGRPESATPRQLPGAAAHFVGREVELQALTRLLGQGPVTTRKLVISVISGTAGVGKTALALRWAHQVADQFPDGQLNMNLRGFDPGGVPVPAQQAVQAFLVALGVPAERIPAGSDARAALYRSQLAGQRVLIVLDNCRDADQVRPLLPGAPGCLVLVTSRSQLTGLAATEDARLLALDVMSEDEASELLASRLGAERTAADPAALAGLISACARLPLALGISAARAAGRPSFPLAVLAAELRDASGRLDALEVSEPPASIRAVFSWSRRYLSRPAAQMFWLQGVHPGPEVTVSAAAALAGVTTRAARRALDELTAASLLAERVPGRYACHDLLRAYAAELADAQGRAARRAPRGQPPDAGSLPVHRACRGPAAGSGP